MSRIYTINLSPTAIAVAADLIEITPADDLPVTILSTQVWQTSDFGDAQEEELTLSWVRGNTTSGSGGNTSVARAPKDGRDAAASMTVETANTTAASSGTAVTPYSTGWNVRMPFERVFTPEEQIHADQGDTLLCLRLGGAPADSLTIGCCVTVREGS